MTEEFEFAEHLPDTFYKIVEDGDCPAPDSLSESVKSYLTEAQDALYKNEFIDMKSANELAVASNYLIELMPSLSLEDQRYACAAIRYFIESDDEEHDFDSIFGFEDDIKVMNHVLEKIGHSEKKIQ
jgi:hypothetical protein